MVWLKASRERIAVVAKEIEDGSEPGIGFYTMVIASALSACIGCRKKGVIDRDIANTLREMSKFRNRLVYLYQEINDEQVSTILQNRLEDLKNSSIA